MKIYHLAYQAELGNSSRGEVMLFESLPTNTLLRPQATPRRMMEHGRALKAGAP